MTNRRKGGIILPCMEVSVEINRRCFMADKVKMECTECKNRNYDTTKNKKHHSERLELKKYCPFCKKHTVHRETK